MLCPLCHASCPVTPRIQINLTPSPLPHLLTLTEPIHSIHLKSSHCLLPTRVDPSNSRALRNSPFSPHCKNQTPAFLLKPTGFTAPPPQRAPSLPTTSAPWSKNQTSAALQLKTAIQRRRRRRRGGILRWNVTRSQRHPQLQ